MLQHIRHILLVVFALCISVSTFARNNMTAQQILGELDTELAKKDYYDAFKYKKIDKLKAEVTANKHNPVKLYDAYMGLGQVYETFRSDSSLKYYDLAINVKGIETDSVRPIKAHLGRAKVLGILGYFQGGVDELSFVESSKIPVSLKELWLDTGRQLYSYMLAYSHGNSEYTQKYEQLLNFYRTEQLKALPANSPKHKLFLAEQYVADGNPTKAKTIFSELLEEVPDNDNIFARAAHNLSSIKDEEGNKDNASYYLALSAISDIKGSVKENISLQELALYLYEKGDIQHAYTYVSASLDDAVFCNAKMRAAEVSKIMPLIDKAYKSLLDQKQRMLILAIVAVSLLSICLICAIIFVWRQMLKVKIARQKLKEANNLKEEYIGHFLDMCSIYMERLDKFSKIVTRKISAGQIEDLMKLAKSSKFLEEEQQKFFETFDATFLHIYPTFVEEFNNLLMENERIEVKDPGKLTNELRIFAFLRMGVEDSNKIAHFLHYSVNTIYTYRNKIKNKAKNRETFEQDVLKICSY